MHFFSKIICSFRYALQGLAAVVRSENNMRIHLTAATVVIIAGFLKGLSKVEWLFIAIAVALVFLSEAFNTAIENLCDLYSQEQNKQIKKIKDISAGAVLIAVLAALTTGIIIFLE